MGAASDDGGRCPRGRHISTGRAIGLGSRPRSFPSQTVAARQWFDHRDLGHGRPLLPINANAWPSGRVWASLAWARAGAPPTVIDLAFSTGSLGKLRSYKMDAMPRRSSDMLPDGAITDLFWAAIESVEGDLERAGRGGDHDGSRRHHGPRPGPRHAGGDHDSFRPGS